MFLFVNKHFTNTGDQISQKVNDVRMQSLNKPIGVFLYKDTDIIRFSYQH